MYSNKAIPQDTAIAMYNAELLTCFRCPYQAKVIKILLAVSNKTVWIKGDIVQLFRYVVTK
jgi:hypothetical protein